MFNPQYLLSGARRKANGGGALAEWLAAAVLPARLIGALCAEVIRL